MGDFYPDTQEIAKVYLVVYLTPSFTLLPRDMYWAVSWDIPTQTVSVYHRFLSLHPVNELEHLVNFGAKTKIVHETPSKKFPLGELDRAGRQKLEDVAATTNVYYPATNGGWGPQDWVEDLLHKAVELGIFDGQMVENAILAGKSVRYPRKR